MKPDKKDYRHIISEEGKMRALRRMVDDCARRLKEEELSAEEAQMVIESVRKKVLGLFPGKEEQFELIYRSRFERILKEKQRNSDDK